MKVWPERLRSRLDEYRRRDPSRAPIWSMSAEEVRDERKRSSERFTITMLLVMGGGLVLMWLS